MSEPREFYIYKYDGGLIAAEFEEGQVYIGKAPPEGVHVIEKSAYDALTAENEKLKTKINSAASFCVNTAIKSSDRADEIIELRQANAELVEARDAYAEAMAIALRDGIFPHKALTKERIEKVLANHGG